ncbi:MAG: hypothetical protein CMO80_11325 [Verrucomicrobiales bacterium]|nr:hypothetical protein [Verrucomicrobiales bacterium]
MTALFSSLDDGRRTMRSSLPVPVALIGRRPLHAVQQQGQFLGGVSHARLSGKLALGESAALKLAQQPANLVMSFHPSKLSCIPTS